MRTNHIQHCWKPSSTLRVEQYLLVARPTGFWLLSVHSNPKGSRQPAKDRARHTLLPIARSKSTARFSWRIQAMQSEPQYTHFFS